MRISDWSSDVCSSDLAARRSARPYVERRARPQSHSRTPLSPRVAGVMADKVDFKKTLDSYRARRGELRIIDVPEMQYLQIDGSGDPNTSPAFPDAVETIHPLANNLNVARKRDHRRHYVVPPPNSQLGAGN